LQNLSSSATSFHYHQGGENCPANMLYYKVLTASAELCTMLGNTTAAAAYTTKAAALLVAIHSQLWDAKKGAFWDNTNNHNMFPQDGNSLAVWFNITTPTEAKVGACAHTLSLSMADQRYYQLCALAKTESELKQKTAALRTP
jgi:hypothetical protein